MSTNAFPPQGDVALSTAGGIFSGLITASPITYSLTAADATALSTALSAYDASLAVVEDPSTRTPVAVAEKDTNRAVLSALMRSYGKRISANPAVTAAQKTALGLGVADHVRTPVPPPSTRPLLAVTDTRGRIVRGRAVDETTPLRRARPDGVDGMQLFTFVSAPGQEPPGNLAQWQFEGLVTRSDFSVERSAEDVGKILHMRGCWYNEKGSGVRPPRKSPPW